VFRRLVCFIAALVVFGLMLPAGSAVGAAPSRGDASPLRVAVVPLEPFVARDGDRADGMYVEIWKRVADGLGRPTEFVWVDAFADLLPAVATGRADVAVAPLGLTSDREAKYDFSTAVLRSGPKLGVSKRLSAKKSILGALFSADIGRLLLGGLFVLVVLAHVIWLVERNVPSEADHFRRRYPHGVWDGFWWAAVTIATVGYGDKAPRSVRGRLVGLLAITCSLFMVGAFVSEVTTTLGSRSTKLAVNSLNDARRHKVGALEGSTFMTYLTAQGVTARGYPTQLALFEAVDKREVDVIVANPYALQVVGPRYGVVPVGDVLYEEFVAFGLAQGSPLREQINAQLAALQSTGAVSAIVNRWTHA
jgi:polar amino acid transport system substrate-binding protein